jgi:hypothetical protein
MRNFSQTVTQSQIVEISVCHASGYPIQTEKGLANFVDDVSNTLERAFSEHNTLDVSQEWQVEEVKSLLNSVIAERRLGLSEQQCNEKIRDCRAHSPSEERVILALANFTAEHLLTGLFTRQQCFVYHNLNEGHCVLVRANS